MDRQTELERYGYYIKYTLNYLDGFYTCTGYLHPEPCTPEFYKSFYNFSENERTFEVMWPLLAAQAPEEDNTDITFHMLQTFVQCATNDAKKMNAATGKPIDKIIKELVTLDIELLPLADKNS